MDQTNHFQDNSARTLLVSAFVISSLLFVLLLTLSFFTRGEKIKTLAHLDIPKVSKTYTPGPLILKQVSTNVLGYQNIIPSDIVKYVNLQRVKKNAKPLKINATLTKAARLRAEVILKYQNFSHQDPYEGIELVTSLHRLGYNYSWASENIGMGGVTAQNFVEGFMNSASHRENLLDPNLLETGVAVVSGNYKNYYVNIAVQMFAIPTSFENYLGYNKEDQKYYQELLAKVNDSLYKIDTILEKGDKDVNYYMSWKVLLEKQKDILANLISAMKNEEPFLESHQEMIRQYNKNWQKAPEEH